MHTTEDDLVTGAPSGLKLTAFDPQRMLAHSRLSNARVEVPLRAHLPKKTRTALGKQGAKMAAKKR